jgi:hypothetical protein
MVASIPSDPSLPPQVEHQAKTIMQESLKSFDARQQEIKGATSNTLIGTPEAQRMSLRRAYTTLIRACIRLQDELEGEY